MARNIDTVFDHDPLYRVEWRDTEDCLVQVSIMNEEAFDYMMKHPIADVVKEAGKTAVSFSWDRLAPKNPIDPIKDLLRIVLQ